MTVRLRCVALALAVYVVGALVLSPGGHLGSDVSAKVAALTRMALDDTNDPGLPYWAVEHDPSGELFPDLHVNPMNGRWYSVTTLPMLIASRPLHGHLGGRAILLLPILGGIATALGAAALARRIGGRPELTFMVVALASPVALYSLDFWEHTLGLALMVWGIVVLVDIVQRTRPAALAAVSGICFGAAGVLRTEAYVYGAVFTAVLGVIAARRRRSWRDLVAIASLSLATVGGIAQANQQLEHAVIGQGVRGARTTTQLANVGSAAAERIRDVTVSLVAPLPTDAAAGIAIRIAMLIAASAAIWWWDDPQRRGIARRAALIAGALLVGLTLPRMGFVPGLAPTAPLAVAAPLALRTRSVSALITGTCMASVGAVFATQYTGGVTATWSARYLLPVVVVAITIGLAHLRSTSLRRILIATSVLVTAQGFTWYVIRSHGVADFFAEVVAQRTDIVVSREANILREAGEPLATGQWLTASSLTRFARAMAIAEVTGADSVLVVDLDAPAALSTIGCYRPSGERYVEFLGIRPPVRLTRMERIASCTPEGVSQ